MSRRAWHACRRPRAKTRADAAIRAELLRTREQAIARLVNSAYAERAAERFDVAEALLKRAEGISPNDSKVKAVQDAVNADRRHSVRLARHSPC